MSQTYAVLTETCRDKAQEFIQDGGRKDDLETSEHPTAVDYRALRKQADAEVWKMYAVHWNTKGIMRHQWLAVPSMIGPVMRVIKRRAL
jgi:hypothetical protein